jgi:hypothetical protein
VSDISFTVREKELGSENDILRRMLGYSTDRTTQE